MPWTPLHSKTLPSTQFPIDVTLAPGSGTVVDQQGAGTLNMLWCAGTNAVTLTIYIDGTGPYYVRHAGGSEWWLISSGSLDSVGSPYIGTAASGSPCIVSFNSSLRIVASIAGAANIRFVGSGQLLP